MITLLSFLGCLSFAVTLHAMHKENRMITDIKYSTQEMEAKQVELLLHNAQGNPYRSSL